MSIHGALDDGAMPRNYGEPMPGYTKAELEEKALIEKVMKETPKPPTEVNLTTVLASIKRVGFKLPDGFKLEERMRGLGIPRAFPFSKPAAAAPVPNALDPDDAKWKERIEDAMRRVAERTPPFPGTAADFEAVAEKLKLPPHNYSPPVGKRLEDRLDYLGIPRAYPATREQVVAWWQADAQRRHEDKRRSSMGK